uniref:Uncharacterized protein n=1 Tax=Vespula pensylvanica TaxID=30213 RepID=A0A834NEB0_VESPE|nr:hypothetical protein H0235_015007 [Vespula pensylvanica]
MPYGVSKDVVFEEKAGGPNRKVFREALGNEEQIISSETDDDNDNEADDDDDDDDDNDNDDDDDSGCVPEEMEESGTKVYSQARFDSHPTTQRPSANRCSAPP